MKDDNNNNNDLFAFLESVVGLIIHVPVSDGPNPVPCISARSR